MSNMLTHTKPVILSLPLPSCLCRVAQAEFWTKELKRGAGRQIAYNTSDYTSSEHQSAVVTQPEPLEGSNSFPQLPAVLAETDGAVAGEGEAEEEPTPVVEPPKPRVPQRTALDGVYWGFEILLQHLSVSGKDATSAAASGSEGEQAGDKATGAESMADAGGDFAAAADADHTVPAAASDECAHETASVASGDFTATSCCDHTSAHDVALRAQSVPVEWICSSDEDITELDVEVIYDECAQEKDDVASVLAQINALLSRSGADVPATDSPTTMKRTPTPEAELLKDERVRRLSDTISRLVGDAESSGNGCLPRALKAA